jgi:hypothetical protein
MIRAIGSVFSRITIAPIGVRASGPSTGREK